MRDANAMQLRLNQIDLKVNAEMQLGKIGCWLNYSEVCSTPQVNTLCVWLSDLVDLIFGVLQQGNDVAAVMSEEVLKMRDGMRRFPGTRGKFIRSVRIGKHVLIIL